jgi:hypothetical protein
MSAQMKRPLLVFLAVATLGHHQVAACAPKDPLCAPLQAFAASVRPNESKEFAFHTMWGGPFKDDPSAQVMYQARCIHNGFEPGKAVCSYLLKHGQIEFSDIDAKHALECLSPTTRLGRQVGLDRGVFTLSYGTDRRGSHVKILYGEDAEIGGMVLRITAEGY